MVMPQDGLRNDVVTLRQASKRFTTPEGGHVRALDGVSLSVSSNEFLTLLGPSGCGKTTLLRIVSGFEELDAGDVLIDGASVRGVPPHRRPVNTVFQNYALFPHLTVDKNVGYSLDVAGVSKNERNRRVSEALELVGLGSMEKRKPDQLSGGQQQRVALARAIISRPKLLLLDEPLSALDRNLRQAMQLELKNLQHELGITFVFVTHDQEEALTMSDRIVVMKQGQIRQLGRPADIYDHPQDRFVAQFIGESNLFAGRVSVTDSGQSVLETDDGVRVLFRRSELTKAERAEILIRPEHLQLHTADHAENQPMLIGQLEQVVFVGSDYQLIVRLTPSRVIKVVMRDAKRSEVPRLKLGASVAFTYDEGVPHIIEGAEE